ncbi:MAG TPA: hypothetical protein VKB15_03520 [Xanthobacteraceae bacterium]|nr:hypothetical protein [Xanthobacteraceae bacterium]
MAAALFDKIAAVATRKGGGSGFAFGDCPPNGTRRSAASRPRIITQQPRPTKCGDDTFGEAPVAVAARRSVLRLGIVVLRVQPQARAIRGLLIAAHRTVPCMTIEGLDPPQPGSHQHSPDQD